MKMNQSKRNPSSRFSVQRSTFDVLPSSIFNLPSSIPALLALLLSFATASAATRYVWQGSPSPGPPYTNWATAAHVIQDAVDAAVAGDEIVVTNGVYATGGRAVHGAMTNRVAVDKPLVLRSVNGPEVTIIQGAQAPGGGTGDGAIRCVYLTNDALLNGFTLTNGATRNEEHWRGEQDCGGGVWCQSASALVTNCVFSGNSAHSSGGGAEWGTLNNCTLSGNLASSGGGANRCTLNNCILTGNSAGLGGGGASSSTLNNCVLTGNSGGNGGGASHSALNHCNVIGNWAEMEGGGVCVGTLTSCIVYYNKAGSQSDNYVDQYNLYTISMSYCCTTPVPGWGPGNITDKPNLADASHLGASSPCIGAGDPSSITGVDIDGQPWGSPPSIGCDEFYAGAGIGPLSVQITAPYTNLAKDFPLQLMAQIEGHADEHVWDFGDGIVVSNQLQTSHAWSSVRSYRVELTAYNQSFPQGISATVTIHVVTPPVHHVSVDSGNPVAPYASWATAATNINAAIAVAAVPGAVVLVTNGTYEPVDVDSPLVLRSLNGPQSTIIDGGGHSRCAHLMHSAILTGFTLTNGYVWGMDGGGACGGTLNNCTLAGNEAIVPGYQCGVSGGGAAYATLNNCTLSGNLVSGEGGTSGGGVALSTLNNCTLTGNSALGGEGGGAYGCTLNNCTLVGNSAIFGGGADGGALNNCTLVGNSAFYGGGACVSTLNNCTLTGNSADQGGGVLGAELNNCILYYNAAPDGANYHEEPWGEVTLNYTCTYPMPTNGVGNITNAPLFVDTNNWADLRLQPNSPCIDAGTDLTGLIATDLLGLPRPMDGNGDGLARFDIGAHEFSPYRFEPTLHLSARGFLFTVCGEPGRSVRIERSPDLVNWEYAGEVPIPIGGQTLIDPAATTEPRLFYRAIRVP